MDVATNQSAEVVKKWKRADVLEYIKSKQNELDLDDEDIKIIEKNKVVGQVFITLIEEKLLAGGPAGAISLLIKAFNGEVQTSASPNKLEKPEESFQEKVDLQTTEAIEKTCINEPSRNLISASEEIEIPMGPEIDDLQTTEATEKICANELPHEPIPTSNFLPETASQLLRYYDVWNRPHKEWPSINKFSDHLYEVHNISEKQLVHSSFKKEIGILQKLFAKEHPAQDRLSELAIQLKSQQNLRKARRTSFNKFAKKSIRRNMMKEKIEIAKDSVIIGGYNRLNEHYDNFHNASSLLVKRNLATDETDHENAKRIKN
ncbi:hypothetical protein C1645_733828 [Glomus cerebriforme]|uniref:SAM domain-containing protein n=1 Tax=Glomus cerebriforme TaxID=658196 RepID=A0A397TLI5_9GLOM|nr:hypothetical protein C1645_733828 [Glomus cerebriforme]